MEAPAATVQDRSSQEQASQDLSSTEVFVDTVSVDIVNVEVFVTDKKDEPVSGLSAESFELLVDGKPTPITNFYAEASGKVMTASSPAQESPPTEDQEETVSGEMEAGETEAQRLHLLVFVDNRNLRATNRKKTFKYLRQFLADELDDEDRVAVVSLDTTLVFRSEFLSDRARLSETLDEVESSSVPETGSAIERQRIFNDLVSDDGFIGLPRLLLSRIQIVAHEDFQNGKASVQALGAVVDSLGGIRGRKAILHISDGISTNPGEGMYAAWVNRFGSEADYPQAIGLYDLLPDFQELARRANAAQVTFYTLDAESNDASIGRSAGNPGGLRHVITTAVLEVVGNNARAPLELAALDTGGRRLEATGRLARQLSLIANDFSTFYSLGFRAPEGASKAKHRIEVKVREKGVTVRHREAYEDKEADRRSGEAVVASLLYNAVETDLGVTLESLEMREENDDTSVLPVLVRIPISRVAFLPQGDQHTAQLTFFVTVKNQKGDLRPVQKVPFKLRIPSDKMEEARGRTADYELPVTLSAGDQQIAISVRDDIGGIRSTLRLEI